MLSEKVIVITGGAGLIGKEFSKAVVQNRGTLIIADINEEIGNDVKDKLKNEFKQSKIDFLKIDISSKESIQICIAQIIEKYGKIDALVNNAYPRNVNYGRNFFDVEYTDFNENVGLHLGGYFLTSQQFAETFKTQGFGNIINMGSIYGVVAPRFEIYDDTNMSMPIEYAVIKSSIIFMTKYMAKYFQGMNIRVNCISPGGILNNQSNDFLKRYNEYGMTKGMLDVKDLIGSFVFLLSDNSKYINGQNIIIDDGWTL